MYERFTNAARETMHIAHAEARRMGHEHIETGHMLLGLASNQKGIAALVLREMQLSVRQLRTDVEKAYRSDPAISRHTKLPMTPQGKHVIETAMEVSRDRKQPHVGTESILIGLIREQTTPGVNSPVNVDFTEEDVVMRAAQIRGPQDRTMDLEGVAPDKEPSWLSRVLTAILMLSAVGVATFLLCAVVTIIFYLVGLLL